jgi:hypothetical protein
MSQLSARSPLRAIKTRSPARTSLNENHEQQGEAQIALHNSPIKLKHTRSLRAPSTGRKKKATSLCCEKLRQTHPLSFYVKGWTKLDLSTMGAPVRLSLCRLASDHRPAPASYYDDDSSSRILASSKS